MEIAAYYFPQYHPDPRNDALHGPGWTEWELVRAARPRFEGHHQPKVPLWGEFDEADPAWAAREIDAAAEHGITAFLYDWYWYEGRPFLEGGLEQGFLCAPNRDRIKFALMWANHDWVNLFPAAPAPPDRCPLLLPGRTARPSWDALCDYVVEHYFSQPNYLHADGAPYFSLYEIGTFVAGLGGWEAARDALDGLRDKARAAGHTNVHLNAVVWGLQVLPSEVPLSAPSEIISELGFDSVTSYVWIHDYAPNSAGFPVGSYSDAAAHAFAAWDKYRAQFAVPYFPNVTMGWDSSPRTTQGVPFEPYGYPWTSVLEGTPEAFGAAVARALRFAEAGSGAFQMVTLNAWNEWTEGSYLLPDTRRGSAYLQALQHARQAHARQTL